eukprot:64904-Rhodomonas_salina.1
MQLGGEDVDALLVQHFVKVFRVFTPPPHPEFKPPAMKGGSANALVHADHELPGLTGLLYRNRPSSTSTLYQGLTWGVCGYRRSTAWTSWLWTTRCPTLSP